MQKPSTPTLAKSISFSNHLNPTNQANQTSPNHVKQTINHGKSSSPRTNSENNIDLKPRDHGSDSLINTSDIQKVKHLQWSPENSGIIVVFFYDVDISIFHIFIFLFNYNARDNTNNKSQFTM